MTGGIDMVTATMAVDTKHNLLKTLHFDERTGNLKILITNMEGGESVRRLKKEIGVALQLSDVTVTDKEVLFSCDAEMNLKESQDITIINSDLSLLSVLRDLVLNDGYILSSLPDSDAKIRAHNLKFPESSFSAQVSYLDKDEQWKTEKLFYHDSNGDVQGLDNLKILVPKNPLKTAENAIERTGREIEIREGDKLYVYDLAAIRDDVPNESVLSVEHTSDKLFVSLAYLRDAYALILKLIADDIFEKRGISSGYRSEKIVYGGYVKISSTASSVIKTLDKYEDELDIILNSGIDNSKQYKTNSLFRMYVYLRQLYADAQQKGKQAQFDLYKALSNTHVLLSIAILDIKMSLFYYEPEVLFQTVSTPGIFKGIINGYSLNLEVGGTLWQPTKF